MIYKLSRRKFLIVAGSLAASALLSGKVARAVTKTPEERAKELSKYLWGMVVDVEKCTECVEKLIEEKGTEDVEPPCVVACRRENNVPKFEDKRITPQWIKIIKVRGKFEGSPTYYFPILCNHCENPPCVQVCLVQASFKREDGIVLIDMHRCIGCRYCMVACPFNSRNFNFKEPLEGLEYINPEVPRRTKGVVEKCTFCVHRINRALIEGKEPVPACVEACPNEALVFGNLKDPNSKISKIVSASKVHRLREWLGTEPKVYYVNL